LGVAGIVIDPTNPDIMYIATGDSFGYVTNSIGVLKSTDGGVTWQKTGLDWTASQGRKIRKLLMDPNDNNMLLAATSEGLFRTINAGINWTLVSTESFGTLKRIRMLIQIYFMVRPITGYILLIIMVLHGHLYRK
jgi:photosystem II stability/assembly factor-like uncharacterized protein